MNFIINPIMLIKSIQCEYLAKLIKVWGFIFFLSSLNQRNREDPRIEKISEEKSRRAKTQKEKKTKKTWKNRKVKETFDKIIFVKKRVRILQCNHTYL